MVCFIGVLVAVAVVELCLRVLGSIWTKRHVAALISNLRTFQKCQDEEERQRLMLRGGFATLHFSLLMTGFVVLLVLIVYFFPWVLSWDVAQEVDYFLVISVFSIPWWLFSVRVKPVNLMAIGQIENYSRIERWFHWLVLQPSAVRNLSFDLERIFALPRPWQRSAAKRDQIAPSNGAVYVCGMARSGTTILLQILAQSVSFKSLTYRDMPFVLAPNLWGLLNRISPREGQLSERFHGDGVLVDYDSPESFEEVFWRTFSGTELIQGHSYGVERIDNDALEKFAEYRALVANPRKVKINTDGKRKRYLSKNNNNLLRLRSLSIDPSATILLMYRDPVETARSLHRLHLRLCTKSGDGFTQNYMTWLGHHEFGPGHLPFTFARSRMNPALSPSQPDYWLDYWNAVYLHILGQHDLRLTLVSYNAISHSPRQMLSAIFALLGEQVDTSEIASQIKPPANKPKPPIEFNSELLSTALATYAQLLKSEKNVFINACEQ